MAVACLGISGEILIRLIYELLPPPPRPPPPPPDPHSAQNGVTGLLQVTLRRQSPPSIINQRQVEEDG